MKITNEFTVHTPIDRAWQVLTDLEGIAPCMPGARLTGVEGDTYQGKVKVKVGPVISEFTGTARFTEKDESARRASIDAKGRDARSAGNAAALVTAVLRPDGDSTVVTVDTDLKISGKLAQFGSGMIKEVSTKLLAQFVTNLEAKLAADEPTPAASTPASSATAAAFSSAPGINGSVAASASSSLEGPAPSPAAVAAAPETAVSPAPVSSAPIIPSPEEFARTESPAVAVEPKPGGDAALAATNPPATIRPTPTPATLRPAASANAPVAPTRLSNAVDEDPEPLDLLEIAGASVYKRLIPVAAGVVVVGAVIAWLISRR